MGSGGGEKRRSRVFMGGEEVPRMESLVVIYVDEDEGL